MAWTAVNPATGERIRSYDGTLWSDAERAVRAAHEAHETWRRTPFRNRTAAMKRAAELLRSRADRYAELMA